MKIESIIPPFVETNAPDEFGYWTDIKTNEKYGGQYISPLLLPNLKKVEEGFKKAMKDQQFLNKLHQDLLDYVGVNTPILYSKELTKEAGGLGKVGKIFLKRTDLHSDASHKPVNAYSSVSLAKHLGYKKVITETGASMNARAVAAAASKLGLEAEVHIGAVDAKKVSLNKDITELYGANIIVVHDSTATLLPAMASALRAWQNDPSAMYVVGSVAGPHPYPLMVRTFASVIGRIARKQFIDKTGKLPDTIWSVCGGGSNLLGMSYAFLEDSTEIFAIESAGKGIETGKHAATITSGAPTAILLGARASALMNSDGQISESETEASGLDFSGVGPEVTYLAKTGKIKFRATTDFNAQKTFQMLTRKAGLLCAIEPCYMIHAALEEIKKRKDPSQTHLLHLCGSGEPNVARQLQFKKENE